MHVATEFGAARSNDAGAAWTLQEVFGAASDRRVFSIVSLGEGRLIAGGPGGVRYSSDGGASWAASATSVGGVSDLHALGRSPLSSLHAFLGIDGEKLDRTEDGGRTWIQMASAPVGGGDCGGISFIKATRRSVVSRLTLRSFLDVYYSNRCGISRLVTSVNPVTRTTSFAGSSAEPRGRSRRYAASRLRQFGTAASSRDRWRSPRDERRRQQLDLRRGRPRGLQRAAGDRNQRAAHRGRRTARSVFRDAGQQFVELRRPRSELGQRGVLRGFLHRGRAPRADERAVQGDVRGL